jgi:isopentenyldiphosphate isomerase
MILLPAQIESIASRKDKTVRITIGTQELTPAQAAELFQLNQKFCYAAIKEESFQASEVDAIENLKTDLETEKTPSQRLRAILYINYQQKPDGYKDFATYYQAKMEKICEHFKSKLE